MNEQDNVFIINYLCDIVITYFYDIFKLLTFSAFGSCRPLTLHVAYSLAASNKSTWSGANIELRAALAHEGASRTFREKIQVEHVISFETDRFFSIVE